MESKKLQKEDLSKASGGTITGSNGTKFYSIFNVEFHTSYTIENFANSVIKKGHDVTANKLPEVFKNKLLKSNDFKQIFESVKRSGVSSCNICISVDKDNNIIAISCNQK